MKERFNSAFLTATPRYFWLLMLLFIAMNSIALYFEFYYVMLVAVLAPLVYYAVFEFDKLYFFVVFITPLSIPLDEFFPGLGFNLSLPSEFVLILLMLIVLLKITQGNFFDFRMIVHPVSLAIGVYLFWMLVTSISSSMPIVSFKHLLAKLWFILPLFFLAVMIFRKKGNMYWFLALSIVSVCLVIFYSISGQLAAGLFNKDAANFVMQPFYNDHTSYGAVLAMFIPVLVGMLFLPKTKGIWRYLTFAVLIIFSVAVVLSYTRAAWISLMAAGGLAVFMLLRLKIRYALLLSLFAIIVLFTYRVEIIDKLSKNKQDASEELSDHVKSMSNIATDASNRERINRWNSALNMFSERPVLGWGPGTYMFQYAPFQKAGDKTIISTNFAEGGNAHSEYIGPLAEQGFLGFLCIVFVFASIVFTALRLYFNLTDKELKLLVMLSLLSLITYMVHGLLNNYLDTDKASVPFWGFAAIICSIDLYHKKNPQLGGAEER